MCSAQNEVYLCNHNIYWQVAIATRDTTVNATDRVFTRKLVHTQCLSTYKMQLIMQIFVLPCSQNLPLYPKTHVHFPLTQCPWPLQSGTSHSS